MQHYVLGTISAFIHDEFNNVIRQRKETHQSRHAHDVFNFQLFDELQVVIIEWFAR